jgi:hypothetical protein
MFTPSLYYTLTEENGWRLGQPQEGEWWRGDKFTKNTEGKTDWRKFGRAYPELPGKYFPYEDLDAFTHGHDISNFFYASYPLDAATNIALWVDLPDAFWIAKVLPTRLFTGNIVEEYIYNSEKRCLREGKSADVIVTFNAVNVDFDSASLYLVQDGQNIYGDEIPLPYLKIRWEDRQKNNYKYKSDVHNLLSPVTIKNRQPYYPRYIIRDVRGLTVVPPPFQNYPTFYYHFDVTCADFENIILVLGGLYYQGKRLPPLKVRMNYTDFSRVPRYVGPNAPARAAD